MFLPVPNGSRLDIIFKLKQRGSEMHFVDAKWILTGSGGHYGMNIYRGCTHGCIYCDSRSRCYQFTHPFEDIEVKQNAPKLLEKALKSKRKKCMIGTGAMSDPYMHCEENLRLTRKCLEIILENDFGVAIQTKSDRILQDIDLLFHDLHRLITINQRYIDRFCDPIFHRSILHIEPLILIN